MKTCKKCGEKIGVFDSGYDGICEMCWKKELKNNSNDQENKDIKNKISSALQNYASIITAVFIFVGIGISIDVHSLYPLIGAIIIGIGQYLFLYAIAEIIQKLQNIEDNTRKWRD